jgi:hypothetical protein
VGTVLLAKIMVLSRRAVLVVARRVFGQVMRPAMAAVPMQLDQVGMDIIAIKAMQPRPRLRSFDTNVWFRKFSWFNALCWCGRCNG